MLTDPQKTKVRFYLGHPSVFRYQNPRLEGIWGALDSDAEALILDILGQLAAFDAQIFGTGGNISQVASGAGVKSLEEISFFGDGSGGSTADKELRRIARALVGRLSVITGVPIQTDIYSSAGWGGDSYSANGLSNGGTGVIKLG